MTGMAQRASDDRFEKIDSDISEAREELRKVEHPYDGDKKEPYPEDKVQDEVREQAELAPDDSETKREELELELMEKGESEKGERIRSAD
jgi:hypothetical protein